MTVEIRESLSGHVVFKGDVKNAQRFTLPFGRYSAAFSGDFVKPSNSDFVIASNPSLIVLASKFVYEDVPYPKASVDVEIDKPQSCLGDPMWISLTSMFSRDTQSQLVVRGKLLFAAVEQGVYLVSVIDSRKLRASTQVDVRGSKRSVVLRLASC